MITAQDLKIDEHRLQRHIDQLALISENPAPVVTRILFSDADLRGRQFVDKLCREAALEVRRDAIGNIFAKWVGRKPELPAVATGSHIDAIPNAGRFDGVVGVLGAIEAMRALKEAGFSPDRSIELIVFTAEEPTRFGIGCVGSRLLSGNLSACGARALKDSETITLQQWLTKMGWPGNLESVRLSQQGYSSFVELHIEQGPMLEKENISIGIVERIAAPSTLRVELTGAGGHAGGMLMAERRDALLAGAEIALAVEKAALHSGSPDTVSTTGIFRIEPGAVNSIPCRAQLAIDLRDTREASRNRALVEIEGAIQEICQRRRIDFRVERVATDPPVTCDPALVELLTLVCKESGLVHKTMISRAYHDSSFMAQICPTAMIFIPCLGGFSHRPDEYSSPEQIKNGVTVLAQALARLSSTPIP
jgi:ureidoglycolate amidohydrolase